MTIDFRAISGGSGVLTKLGLKTCLPPPSRSPLLSLSADRIETGATLGIYPSPDLRAIEGTPGHTLRRHVGLSDDALRDRALRTHHDVSCFDDATVAQRTVDAAFEENQSKIGRWIDARRGGNLDLHVRSEHSVGRVFRYDLGRFERARDADVILEHSPQMPQGFTVITAYPSAT